MIGYRAQKCLIIMQGVGRHFQAGAMLYKLEQHGPNWKEVRYKKPWIVNSNDLASVAHDT